jgi:hypothetical protein
MGFTGRLPSSAPGPGVISPVSDERIGNPIGEPASEQNDTKTGCADDSPNDIPVVKPLTKHQVGEVHGETAHDVDEELKTR